MIPLCTDDRCSFPMHTLVTAVIDSQGGSSLLTKILNRLAVCSSADTLSRFINHKSALQLQHLRSNLATDSFTVVSVDNIDYLHSYARVCQNNQKSSWHGNTVQVVQPLPSLSLPKVATASPDSISNEPELPLSSTLPEQEAFQSPIIQINHK